MLCVHRLTGTPRPGDPNRWETIARARNQGRTLGASPWVMCLDDDVVLEPDCLAQLLEGLQRRPEFAALAADSAGEMSRIWEHWDYPSHVGMAAVMFRRQRLAELTFRWEDDKCECLCCCEDLRAASQGIGYHPGALGMASATGRRSGPTHRCPIQLARTIDRRNRQPAVRATTQTRPDPRGLRSPRPAQVSHAVSADSSRLGQPRAGVGLRLWPLSVGTGAARKLSRASRSMAVPHDGVCPALRRLRDFQCVVAEWPEDTPVAYWDAGDVLFQGPLGPLWDMVDAHPDILLIAAEPKSYPENPVIRMWSDRVLDPSARARAFEIMSTHVFLNSGFAAGTASALCPICVRATAC